MSHHVDWQFRGTELMADWSELERKVARQDLGVETRDDGTAHEGHVDDRLVLGSMRLVAGSQVMPRLAHWHTLERKGPGGRPAFYASDQDRDRGQVVNPAEEPDVDGRDNRDHLILVCMIVLQRLGEPPQQKRVVDLIMRRLTPYARTLLGVPASPQSNDAAVKARVQRAWKRFTSVCDPFPSLTGGRRLSRSEVEALQEALDADESREKAERLRWVMNQLLEATVQLLDEETRKEWKGHVSLDATPIHVWGKRGHPKDKRKMKPTDSMSPEYMAGWYQINNEAPVWAYALHLAVSTPDPYDPGRFPIIAVGASMDSPSRRNSANAVAICRSIVDRGHPVGDMVTDRGYFSQGIAEDFNRPIEALGYRLVGDYKKDQKGLMGAYRGAIMVDGNLYSPGMPEHLIDASLNYEIDRDWKTYQQRVQQRRFWLIKRKDEDRYVCPALTARATVSCPLRPTEALSSGVVITHKEHVIADRPPAHPGDVCTQGSVKISRADLGKYEKYAQDLQYGSQEWEDRYSPARSMVEGYNGYSKNAAHEALEKSANRRVRGFAANALAAAVALVATNVRKIAFFYAKDRPLPSEPKPKPTNGEFTGPPAWVRDGRQKPGWDAEGPPVPLAA